MAFEPPAEENTVDNPVPAVLFPSSNSSMNRHSSDSVFPSREDVLRQREQGMAYSRSAGIAVGLFLILWSPFNLLRWEEQGPGWLLIFQAIFFMFYGLLLVLPWKKLASTRWWKPLFILLCAAGVTFIFTMVIDLIFQYMLAAEQGEKPAPPAFQGILIFISSLQLPTVLFIRNPKWLD